MTFDGILEHLKAGKSCTRKEWNNNYVNIVIKIPDYTQIILQEINKTQTYPWQINHLDILADDWEVIE